MIHLSWESHPRLSFSLRPPLNMARMFFFFQLRQKLHHFFLAEQITISLLHITRWLGAGSISTERIRTSESWNLFHPMLVRSQLIHTNYFIILRVLQSMSHPFIRFLLSEYISSKQLAWLASLWGFAYKTTIWRWGEVIDFVVLHKWKKWYLKLTKCYRI